MLNATIQMTYSPSISSAGDVRYRMTFTFAVAKMSQRDNVNMFDKLSQLLIYGAQRDTSEINRMLDEINQKYRHTIITNSTKALLLVHQCCTLIQPDDLELVCKCCQLISNLIKHQHLQIEGKALAVAVQWCLEASKYIKNVESVVVLVTFESLLRANLQNPNQLVIDNRPLVNVAQNGEIPEIIISAVHCLEACTGIPDNSKNKTRSSITEANAQFGICGNVFLKYLVSPKPSKFNDILYTKLLISCLCGIQNIIIQDPEFLLKELELILGLSKTYMVHGIKGVEYLAPQKVLPSILNVPESTSNVILEKKGGKLTKQRKRRPNKKDAKNTEVLEALTDKYVPAKTTFDLNYDDLLQPQMSSGLKTSDSDFSDTENGRVAKLGVMQSRVRQAALHNLFHVIKLTEKHLLFRYWPSLVPDSPSSGVHNLTTCILKDPSPRGRMAALNVLLVLLESSKTYLLQAEFNEKCMAYTPFSSILASILKNLHKSLILTLQENSLPVLTQALKCLGGLVQATPYPRLAPGLVTKVLRNVKVYMNHRDATIQTASLIVAGCVLASEPLVLETREALLKQVRMKVNVTQRITKNCLSDNEKSIEYTDFSSDDEENLTKDEEEKPWLLETCLNNLGVFFSENNVTKSAATPVKLESLQVISAMTRNYFDCLIAPYLSYIAEALNICLVDTFFDLRLHAGRTLDFIGQAMNLHFNSDCVKCLTVEQAVAFWQTLLNANALTSLIQCEQHCMLRAAGCDCLGSIGPNIFERFPRDKQLLIITLLFGCSRDDETIVRGAAVRALALCILYPTLREDPGFVVDVAEVIMRTLQDDNLTVRIKSSWSLGNYSDALVLNQGNRDLENIPDTLLLQLIKISVVAANDNDKIRVNAVRGLGNLLQLFTQALINQKVFKEAVANAIAAVINGATTGTNMKVRWNSCYAIGNILKNPSLYQSPDVKTSLLFNALLELVNGFRNFKVRINAALALACPATRELYGQNFHSVWCTLLEALENAQSVQDFSEYNHRDQLIEQICLTLGHVTTLLLPEDLTHINSSVIFYLDLFKLQVHRVLERLVPEKSSVLLLAVTHLNDLLLNIDVSEDNRTLIKILLDIFTNDIYI